MYSNRQGFFTPPTSTALAQYTPSGGLVEKFHNSPPGGYYLTPTSSSQNLTHLSRTLDPNGRDPMLLNYEVNNKAQQLMLKKIDEQAKQEELKTALLAAQVKQIQIQNEQLMATLEITKSGFVQELLKTQTEATTKKTKLEEEYFETQTKIAQITINRMEDEESHTKKIDEEFKSSRFSMFS